MSVRFIVAMLSFAVGLGAALPPLPVSAQLSCAVVPQVLSPLPDGRSYAFVLGSLDQEPAQLDVSLYSASRAYRVELREVRFDKPSDLGFATRARRPFQSAPYFIALPKADELTLVIVNPLAAASTSPGEPCDAFLYTELARQQQYPRYATPGSVTMEASRLTELSGSSSATPVTLVGQTPFSCARPFADVVTTHPVEPNYPETARREHATGTVQVKLMIDASGLVAAATIYKSSRNALLDDAALAAARASTYAPARVRCLPSSSTYLFRVDFSSQ
jgi:TonB family protein